MKFYLRKDYSLYTESKYKITINICTFGQWHEQKPFYIKSSELFYVFDYANELSKISIINDFDIVIEEAI